MVYETGMEKTIELRIRKRKCWEKRLGKIRKPHLYILLIDGQGKWMNTLYWTGNREVGSRWGDHFRMLGPVEASIEIVSGKYGKVMVVGTSGTDLHFHSGKVSGFSGKSGYTLFGYFDDTGDFVRVRSKIENVFEWKQALIRRELGFL